MKPTTGAELLQQVFKLYSKLEIAYTMLRLCRMSAKELEEYLLAKRGHLPITEEIICRSLLKDRKAGSLYNLNQIWNRLYGMNEFGKGFADEIESLFNSTNDEAIKETLSTFRGTVKVLEGEAKKLGEAESLKIQKVRKSKAAFEERKKARKEKGE